MQNSQIATLASEQSNQINAAISGPDIGCLKDDLIRDTSSLDGRIVNLYIFNQVARFFEKILGRQLPPYLIGLLTSATVFLVSLVVLMISGKLLLQVILHLFIVSVLSGLALVVMKSALQYNLQILFDITDCFCDEKAFTDIKTWLRNVSNPIAQILASVLFALLGCAVVFAWSASKSSVPIYFSSYIVTFVAGFILGNGAYFALTVPTIVRVFSKCRFHLYCFAPSDSPFIRKIKTSFGMMTIANAIIFSIGMMEIYLMGPFGSKTTMRVALCSLIFGLLIVSYSFLYPHYFLTRIVRREKWAVLEIMQAKINKLYSEHDIPDSKNATEIKALMELYDLAKQSSDSSLNFAVLRTYVSSLILPTASFIAGLINWNEIV
jgi:hypothetical protein